MERTEQMYTLHTQLDFGKVKVGGLGGPRRSGPSGVWRAPRLAWALAPGPAGLRGRGRAATP